MAYYYYIYIYIHTRDGKQQQQPQLTCNQSRRATKTQLDIN